MSRQKDPRDEIAAQAALEAAAALDRWAKRTPDLATALETIEALRDELAEALERAAMRATMLAAADTLAEVKLDRLLETKASFDFVRAPYERAIQVFKAREVVPHALFEVLGQEAKRQAFSVADAASLDAIDVIKAALEGSLETGDDLRGFSARVREAFAARGWTGEEPYNLETIFRTNTLGAYGEARFRSLQTETVKKARPYLMWVATLDDRTRETHAAAHGKIMKADDPEWRRVRPPAGFNCRCTLRSLRLEDAEERDGAAVRYIRDPMNDALPDTYKIVDGNDPVWEDLPDEGFALAARARARLLAYNEEDHPRDEHGRWTSGGGSGGGGSKAKDPKTKKGREELARAHVADGAFKTYSGTVYKPKPVFATSRDVAGKSYVTIADQNQAHGDLSWDVEYGIRGHGAPRIIVTPRIDAKAAVVASMGAKKLADVIEKQMLEDAAYPKLLPYEIEIPDDADPTVREAVKTAVARINAKHEAEHPTKTLEDRLNHPAGIPFAENIANTVAKAEAARIVALRAEGKRFEGGYKIDAEQVAREVEVLAPTRGPNIGGITRGESQSEVAAALLKMPIFERMAGTQFRYAEVPSEVLEQARLAGEVAGLARGEKGADSLTIVDDVKEYLGKWYEPTGTGADLVRGPSDEEDAFRAGWSDAWKDNRTNTIQQADFRALPVVPQPVKTEQKLQWSPHQQYGAIIEAAPISYAQLGRAGSSGSVERVKLSEAMRGYSSSWRNVDAIQKADSTGHGSEEAREAAKSLRAAQRASFDAKETATLWRGMANMPGDVFSAYLHDDVIQLPRMSSATVSTDAALDFVRDRYSDPRAHDKTNYRTLLEVRGGTGAWVQAMSPHPSEYEVVMPRGQELKVIDRKRIRVDGKDALLVVTEAIGDPFASDRRKGLHGVEPAWLLYSEDQPRDENGRWTDGGGSSGGGGGGGASDGPSEASGSSAEPAPKRPSPGGMWYGGSQPVNRDGKYGDVPPHSLLWREGNGSSREVLFASHGLTLRPWEGESRIVAHVTGGSGPEHLPEAHAAAAERLIHDEKFADYAVGEYTRAVDDRSAEWAKEAGIANRPTADRIGVEDARGNKLDLPIETVQRIQEQIRLRLERKYPTDTLQHRLEHPAAFSHAAEAKTIAFEGLATRLVQARAAGELDSESGAAGYRLVEADSLEVFSRAVDEEGGLAKVLPGDDKLEIAQKLMGDPEHFSERLSSALYKTVVRDQKVLDGASAAGSKSARAMIDQLDTEGKDLDRKIEELSNFTGSWAPYVEATDDYFRPYGVTSFGGHFTGPMNETMTFAGAYEDTIEEEVKRLRGERDKIQRAKFEPYLAKVSALPEYPLKAGASSTVISRPDSFVFYKGAAAASKDVVDRISADQILRTSNERGDSMVAESFNDYSSHWSSVSEMQKADAELAKDPGFPAFYDRTKNHARAMREAQLDSFDAGERATVWRGMSNMTPELFETFAAEDEVTLDRMVSATIAQKVADDFADDKYSDPRAHNKTTPLRAVLEIRGAAGAWVYNSSPHKEEYEVVLPRDQKLKILERYRGKTEKNDNVLFVIAEAVGDPFEADRPILRPGRVKLHARAAEPRWLLYSEDQARDELGRWTSEGGSAGSSASKEEKSAAPAAEAGEASRGRVKGWYSSEALEAEARTAGDSTRPLQERLDAVYRLGRSESMRAVARSATARAVAQSAPEIAQWVQARYSGATPDEGTLMATINDRIDRFVMQDAGPGALPWFQLPGLSDAPRDTDDGKVAALALATARSGAYSRDAMIGAIASGAVPTTREMADRTNEIVNYMVDNGRDRPPSTVEIRDRIEAVTGVVGLTPEIKRFVSASAAYFSLSFQAGKEAGFEAADNGNHHTSGIVDAHEGEPLRDLDNALRADLDWSLGDAWPGGPGSAIPYTSDDNGITHHPAMFRAGVEYALEAAADADDADPDPDDEPADDDPDMDDPDQRSADQIDGFSSPRVKRDAVRPSFDVHPVDGFDFSQEKNATGQHVVGSGVTPVFDKMFPHGGPSIEDLEKTWVGRLSSVKGNVEDGEAMIEFDGAITSDDGRKIGTFTRKLVLEDGDFVATHDYYKIEDSKQGKGTSYRMMKRSIELYDSVGVDRIEVHTEWVGRYTWAIHGFDFADYSEVENRREGLANYLEHRLGMDRAEARDAVEHAHLEHAWDFAEFDIGKTVVPDSDVAEREPPTVNDDGFERKGAKLAVRVGKAFMLDTPGWDGVLSLDRSSPTWKRAQKRFKLGEKGGGGEQKKP
jgi:SPP1 gp7 family putative phage head morphogenesis protein